MNFEKMYLIESIYGDRPYFHVVRSGSEEEARNCCLGRVLSEIPARLGLNEFMLYKPNEIAKRILNILDANSGELKKDEIAILDLVYKQICCSF